MEATFEYDLRRLSKALGPGVELTASEAKTLRWLADCESSTVSNLVSIFAKVRQGAVSA